MTSMISTTNFKGAPVALALIAMLLQSSSASAEFDHRTHHDPQLLGTSKCLFGPSYWCKSMSIAISCKAVDHCIQTMWRTQKNLKDIKGPMCLTCKKGVDLVLQDLKNHYSEDKVINDLDKVCNMLSISSKISHCKSRINAVMPLLMINSADVVVNSHSVCSALNLCLTTLVDEHTLENEKVNKL